LNLIVFTSRRGRTWQLTPSRPLVLGVVGSILIAVFCAGLLMGRQFDATSGETVLSQLRAELGAQQAALEAVRADSGRNLDALAIRLGQLSAHITRLDALGQRLVARAGLEDGEFNFGQEPPQGGPEAPDGAPSLESAEITQLLDDLQMQIENRSRQLDVLEALLINRSLNADVRPEGRPVSTGWMSSTYGYRSDPFNGRRSFHGGMDFAGASGTEVLAVASGVVIWSGERHGYGHLIEIDHGNGLTTRYGHNQKNLVAVGETVKKGQSIALMGSTGRSTAPHVHLEVLQDGRRLNPAQYVR
jgi:murein DD-endopeptidase MepM/ murein hydrolase activator NlpD